MILDEGIAHFLRPVGKPEPGRMPGKDAKEYHSAWFKSRTVGVHRFFEARQAGQRIDRLIRILRAPEEKRPWADDVCKLGSADAEYRVVQVQDATDEDSGEEVFDITLERMSGLWQ